MARFDYYPTTIDSQIQWLENFWTKFNIHGTTLGYAAPEVAAVVADARWLVYVKGIWLSSEKQWHKSIPDAVSLAESGTSGTVMALPLFAPPALPAVNGTLPAVVPVNQGALSRIFALVQDLKLKPTYNDSMGNDLGVIGSAMTGPDFATLAPSLTLSIVSSQVFVKWGWGGYSQFLDACELQVDRSTGAGWELLAFDTTPNYTDTAPFPDTFTNWKYRAVYRNDSARVGQWSAVASIGVGG